MTLEQRLKDLESINHVSKSDHVDLLIQALRKAIKQRDHFIRELRAYDENDVVVNTIVADSNKELLEILEGK